MALPKQVQAALDAAEATLTEANAPAQPEGAFAEAPPPDAQEQSLQQFDEAKVEPPPPPPPPPQADDLWERKYRVLQGKYDAEVPQLHHRARELETNLRQAVERLNAASEAKEAAPTASTTADPKDVENFGSDLVDMVSRVANAAVQTAARAFDAKLSKYEQVIAKLNESVDGTTRQVAYTAEQSFLDRVTKLVPNWEAVNADPAFLAWLAETDPVYGLPRQAALTQAQQGLNAEHAAAVFKAFLGNQVPAKKQNSLENQISPRAASSAQPTPAEKQVYTQAQVTKFYDDWRRGAYRGNEQEAQRIEQLINVALSEGRVR